MPLKECINNLTHSPLQQGDDMGQRGIGAPPSATKDLETSCCSGDDISICKDPNWQPFASPPGPHRTGGVHAGTPQSTVADISAIGLYLQRTAYHSRLKNE
jgi:hypothetical protein